jgi:hypothetical protein
VLPYTQILSVERVSVAADIAKRQASVVAIVQFLSQVYFDLIPETAQPGDSEELSIMRRFSLQDSLKSLEALERKLSLSSLAFVGAGRASRALPVIVRVLDDDPPPDPEPAPPVNPINGPIQYPTLPPSGPLGPG